jgi:hypothetical protein
MNLIIPLPEPPLDYRRTRHITGERDTANSTTRHYPPTVFPYGEYLRRQGYPTDHLFANRLPTWLMFLTAAPLVTTLHRTRQRTRSWSARAIAPKAAPTGPARGRERRKRAVPRREGARNIPLKTKRAEATTALTKENEKNRKDTKRTCGAGKGRKHMATSGRGRVRKLESVVPASGSTRPGEDTSSCTQLTIHADSTQTT